MALSLPRLTALGLGSLLFCGAIAAHAADVVITESARARFTAGVNLLKDPESPRYEEAYREFKAAYAESPSYKILLNLGICAMKLERDEEAIEAFEKYLKEAPSLAPQDASQIKADLSILKAGVVRVKVDSNPPGAMLVDTRVPVSGNAVTNTYGPLRGPTPLALRQGRHILTAKLPGRPDVVWEIEASGSELPDHAFVFPEPEPTIKVADTSSVPMPAAAASRPVPTPVWIGLATTGALAVGAVVTGALAMSKHSEFERLNDGSNPAAAEEAKSSGQTLNVVTDVLLGSTIVAAGVTAVLFLSRPSVEAAAAPRGVALRPAAGPGGGGVWLRGTF